MGILKDLVFDRDATAFFADFGVDKVLEKIGNALKIPPLITVPIAEGIKGLTEYEQMKMANNHPKWKKLYQFSILGVSIGLLGFIFDPGWVRDSFFVLGGMLCGIGWVLGMKKQADRTLGKEDESHHRPLD